MSDTAGFGIVPRYLRGTLSAFEIAMYVVLSWRADENGVSWAGQGTLAEDAGMSRSTVQRALKGLEEKGLVKSKPWANAKGRSTNVYALRIWTEPVLSQGTIKRQGGHVIEPASAGSSRSKPADVPSQGTPTAHIRADDVPSQGTSQESAETGGSQVGVRLTDADRCVSQTQRKKNHKNETTTRSLKERMAEARQSGGNVAPLLAEIAESLGWAPTIQDLAKAEKTWPWAHGGWKSVEVARDYVLHCRAKGWTPTTEGWLSSMEFEHNKRERQPRRIYGADGVPL